MAKIKEYSLIKNGKAINRIVADEKFIESIRHEYDLITDSALAVKGASWDGEKFTPPVVVPVAPKQTLEDKIDALVVKVSDLEAAIAGLKGSHGVAEIPVK